MDSDSNARPNRIGSYMAAGYILLVVVVFAFTEYNIKPDNVGYDWIPFLFLAWPCDSLLFGELSGGWSIILGLILNAGILYLLGLLIEKLRRKLFWK